MLQHECSRLVEIQADGEQVPDAVAGQSKHLPESISISKLWFCAVSVKYLLFGAQEELWVWGTGDLVELMSGMSPHSYLHQGLVCLGHQQSSAQPFGGYQKAPVP